LANRNAIDTVTGAATDQNFTPVTGTDVGTKRALDSYNRNPASDPSNVNQVNLKNSTLAAQASITVASGFVVSAVTDQEALLIQPVLDNQEWYWSTTTGAAPTSATGIMFRRSLPLVLNNWEQDIIIAPASSTATAVIVKGIL